MNVINKVIKSVFQIWSTCLFLSLVICLLTTVVANDSIIDEDHLKKYPFCGRMSIDPRSGAHKSRVVNSGPPKDNYRWALFIRRQNLNDDDTYSYRECSGSVITDK